MQIASPIGIDLGTTNSVAGIYDGNRAKIIRSSLGYTTIPSVLTFGRNGERVVGQQAERQMVLRPHECVYGSKRLLGRPWAPTVEERFQPHFAYQLVPDEQGLVAAHICGQTLPLVDVSALILKELKDAAAAAMGSEVRQAVITVPAYFCENQRAFVRRAGELAQLEVLRVVSEPTAAAMCFGAGQSTDQRVLVFDLGGGTFDVSIVEIGTYSVIGVDGDSFLGGLDFDNLLAEIVREKLSATIGRDADLDAIGRARMLVAVRSAKHELSQQPQARIEIRCFGLADGEMINVDETVARDEYIAACQDLLDKMRLVVRRALDRSRLQPSDIDHVLLVGGQTRMPAVQQLISDIFGKPPTKRVHPDEAVALGASIVAFSHKQEQAESLRDILPLPIGTCAADGQFQTLVPRNTRLPTDMTIRLRAQPRFDELALPFFQGEGGHVFDNELLGAVVFEGLPANEPLERIIRLRLDAEGLLQLHARGPNEQQLRPFPLATGVRPDEMLTELRCAQSTVVIESTAVTPERVRRESARRRSQSNANTAVVQPGTSRPAPARPGAPSATPAQRYGSARVDPPKTPWWRKLFAWLGKKS